MIIYYPSLPTKLIVLLTLLVISAKLYFNQQIELVKFAYLNKQIINLLNFEHFLIRQDKDSLLVK